MKRLLSQVFGFGKLRLVSRAFSSGKTEHPQAENFEMKVFEVKNMYYRMIKEAKWMKNKEELGQLEKLERIMQDLILQNNYISFLYVLKGIPHSRMEVWANFLESNSKKILKTFSTGLLISHLCQTNSVTRTSVEFLPYKNRLVAKILMDFRSEKEQMDHWAFSEKNVIGTLTFLKSSVYWDDKYTELTKLCFDYSLEQVGRGELWYKLLNSCAATAFSLSISAPELARDFFHRAYYLALENRHKLDHPSKLLIFINFAVQCDLHSFLNIQLFIGDMMRDLKEMNIHDLSTLLGLLAILKNLPFQGVEQVFEEVASRDPNVQFLHCFFEAYTEQLEKSQPCPNLEDWLLRSLSLAIDLQDSLPHLDFIRILTSFPKIKDSSSKFLCHLKEFYEQIIIILLEIKFKPSAQNLIHISKLSNSFNKDINPVLFRKLIAKLFSTCVWKNVSAFQNSDIVKLKFFWPETDQLLQSIPGVKEKFEGFRPKILTLIERQKKASNSRDVHLKSESSFPQI